MPVKLRGVQKSGNGRNLSLHWNEPNDAVRYPMDRHGWESFMAARTIIRADLSEAVYQEVGLSRNESAELVESVLNEISDALVRGEMVKLSSFGSFSAGLGLSGLAPLRSTHLPIATFS